MDDRPGGEGRFGARSAGPRCRTVTFPVAGTGGSSGVTAHGWGSTAFTGDGADRGQRPAHGEVVLDAGGPRREGRRRRHRHARTQPADGLPGRGLAEAGPGTPHEHRRRARPPPGSPTPRRRTLSGHPGRVDAIAVLAEDGVARRRPRRSQVADGPRPAPAPSVHTGDDRGRRRGPRPRLREGDAHRARRLLRRHRHHGRGLHRGRAPWRCRSAQRAREFALLRAVGATPRQIRRAVATEALLVAPLAGLAGCLPGIALARLVVRAAARTRARSRRRWTCHVSWIPLLVGRRRRAAHGARSPAGRPGAGPRGSGRARRSPRPPWSGCARASIRTPLGRRGRSSAARSSPGLAASRPATTRPTPRSASSCCFMLAVALLGPLVARRARPSSASRCAAAGPSACTRRRQLPYERPPAGLRDHPDRARHGLRLDARLHAHQRGAGSPRSSCATASRRTTSSRTPAGWPRRRRARGGPCTGSRPRPSACSGPQVLVRSAPASTLRCRARRPRASRARRADLAGCRTWTSRRAAWTGSGARSPSTRHWPRLGGRRRRATGLPLRLPDGTKAPPRSRRGRTSRGLGLSPGHHGPRRTWPATSTSRLRTDAAGTKGGDAGVARRLGTVPDRLGLRHRAVPRPRARRLGQHRHGRGPRRLRGRRRRQHPGDDGPRPPARTAARCARSAPPAAR